MNEKHSFCGLSVNTSSVTAWIFGNFLGAAFQALNQTWPSKSSASWDHLNPLQPNRSILHKIESYNCLAISEWRILPILGFQLPSQDSDRSRHKPRLPDSLNLLETDMLELDQDRTLTKIYSMRISHIQQFTLLTTTVPMLCMISLVPLQEQSGWEVNLLRERE